MHEAKKILDQNTGSIIDNEVAIKDVAQQLQIKQKESDNSGK